MQTSLRVSVRMTTGLTMTAMKSQVIIMMGRVTTEVPVLLLVQKAAQHLDQNGLLK